VNDDAVPRNHQRAKEVGCKKRTQGQLFFAVCKEHVINEDIDQFEADDERQQRLKDHPESIMIIPE
jgi:hypothetical protein